MYEHYAKIGGPARAIATVLLSPQFISFLCSNRVDEATQQTVIQMEIFKLVMLDTELCKFVAATLTQQIIIQKIQQIKIMILLELLLLLSLMLIQMILLNMDLLYFFNIWHL